jgi:hypothetical protein
VEPKLEQEISPMNRFRVALAQVALLCSAGIASAGEIGQPVRLDAAQMDKITAGTASEIRVAIGPIFDPGPECQCNPIPYPGPGPWPFPGPPPRLPELQAKLAASTNITPP